MQVQTTWDEARAAARIAELEHLPGAMLPILQALQEEFGYIDRNAVPLVAEALNVSRAEVIGVINFYHDFRQEPPGRHIVRVCRAEACQAVGCEALVEHLRDRFGIAPGVTTDDGRFTFESVYCLGNCALGPAVMLDDRLYGRVSPEVANRLLGEVAG